MLQLGNEGINENGTKEEESHSSYQNLLEAQGKKEDVHRGNFKFCAVKKNHKCLQ